MSTTTKAMINEFNENVPVKGYNALRGTEKLIRSRVMGENKNAMKSALKDVHVTMAELITGTTPVYNGHELTQNADFTFSYEAVQREFPFSELVKRCEFGTFDVEAFGYGLIRLAGGNDEWEFVVPSSRVMREWLESVTGRKVRTQTMRHIAETFSATVKVSKDGKTGYITVKPENVIKAIIQAFKLDGCYEVKYTKAETARERAKRHGEMWMDEWMNSGK